MPVIGDAGDPATVLADARAFFDTYFDPSDEGQASWLRAFFSESTFPPFWPLGQLTAALVQVYDLVAPLDAILSEALLRRLGVFATELLANRDDKRGFPADPFRRRVMPAWGALTADRDGKWNTDVDTSGLFCHAMAAFAARVARRPALHARHGAAAIQCINGVLETFEGFRPELHVDESDPHAYFTVPRRYADLRCDGNSRCQNYKDLAGKPLPYNQNLSMMQALAELALAGDSDLYRGSRGATLQRLRVLTEELPLIVAKNVAFFADHLSRKTLDDGSPYFAWNYQHARDRVEDTAHGQFELGCLAAILDNRTALDTLLERAGRRERIRPPFFFAPMATTFLRKVWRNNTLAKKVDGDGDGERTQCGGWIPFSQFDPWVWKRARDTVFATPSVLNVDTHAALLRYRKFSTMKVLTEFAGQNWLITPAAAAVGEPRPATIHDQRWMLVLSGVVLANHRGDNSGNWNNETVSFMPDMAGPDSPTATSGPLNWAIKRFGIPRPAGSPGAQYLVRFAVEEIAPFASLGAVFNQDQSINSGFAVNTWRPAPYGSGTNALTNQPVAQLFSGINVDVAVRDHDAWLYRLSYNITLIGRIVFVVPTF